MAAFTYYSFSILHISFLHEGGQTCHKGTLASPPLSSAPSPTPLSSTTPLTELTLPGDDSYPKCKQCERLGERCRRGKGKLKFRVGSSAKYDAAFSKDQTWLDQTKNGKFV